MGNDQDGEVAGVRFVVGDRWVTYGTTGLVYLWGIFPGPWSIVPEELDAAAVVVQDGRVTS